jgi:hypothetical protein
MPLSNEQRTALTKALAPPTEDTTTPFEGRVSGAAVDELADLARDARNVIAPATACAGCTKPHCCTFQVPITDIEAMILVQRYESYVRTMWSKIVERAMSKPTREPCLFLGVSDPENGALCGVYPHAPANCAYYWVSGMDTPDKCEPGAGGPEYGRIIMEDIVKMAWAIGEEESRRLGLSDHSHRSHYIPMAIARVMVLFYPELAKDFQDEIVPEMVVSPRGIDYQRPDTTRLETVLELRRLVMNQVDGEGCVDDMLKEEVAP